ncbi:MAG: phage tail protein [Paludibacter sp.]|nr:phage tail protein [Paludibacter sp.]
MTNNSGQWALPKFYFEVEWDSQKASFQEVSGLDEEGQIIEYRHGDELAFSTIKMPGIKKSETVTMKKGVFNADDKFFNWYKEVKANTIKRTTVTIKLMDELDAPVMTWILSNVLPIKITAVDMSADGKEVFVESVEMMHEGILSN